MLFMHFVHGQTDVYDFEQAAVHSGVCNPFAAYAATGQTNDWLPAHGAASIIIAQDDIARFRSGTNGGNPVSDGLYLNYTFEEGATYRVEISARYPNLLFPDLEAVMTNNLIGSNNLDCDMEPLLNSILISQEVPLPGGMQTGNNFNWITSGDFVADADYGQFWLYAEPGIGGVADVNQVNIELVRPAPARPRATINGSATERRDVCTGEPLIFSGADSEDYDGYLIEVAEYDNGYVGPIAEQWVETGAIPTSLDLYNFVANFGGGWHMMGGRSYRLKLAAWRNDPDPDPDTWAEVALYLDFEPTIPQGHLLTVDEWVPTSAANGWTVDVANYCAAGDLYLDGSASTCYDRYRVNIREFNLQNWSAGPMATTNWILGTGNIGTINLSQLYNNAVGNFVDGRVYHVALVTAFPHTVHDLFFRKIANPDPNGLPTVDGEFEGVFSEELTYSPGGGFGFPLYEICANNFDLIFDATRTTCENRHRIRIVEFDWVNWVDIDLDPTVDPNSNAYYSDWMLESAPDQIVLSDLYTNFQVGSTYRFSLEAGQGYAVENYIFKVKSLDYLCAEAPPNDDRSGRIRKTATQVQLLPTLSENGQSYLQFVDGQTPAEFSYTIYHSNGQQVRHLTKATAQDQMIDLSNQPAGMYLVRVEYNGQVELLKMIRQ